MKTKPQKIHASAVDAIGNTPIVKLQVPDVKI